MVSLPDHFTGYLVAEDEPSPGAAVCSRGPYVGLNQQNVDTKTIFG